MDRCRVPVADIPFVLAKPNAKIKSFDLLASAAIAVKMRLFTMKSAIPSNAQDGPGRRGRLLLIEDHALIRVSLEELIHQNTPHQVVGSTGDGREAISLAMALQPDMALMDFHLGDGMEGVQLIQALRTATPRTRILVLSAQAHTERLEEVRRCGAVGLVGKNEPPEILFSAIVHALAGDVPVHSRKPNPGALATLSDRERFILRLFATGYAVREIAVKLGISRKTVEAHRTNIRAKLAIESSDDLRRFARDHFGTHVAGDGI